MVPATGWAMRDSESWGSGEPKTSIGRLCGERPMGSVPSMIHLEEVGDAMDSEMRL